AKFVSSLFQACCDEVGIRMSTSVPIGKSKCVTKAAPPRQRFSLEVSSVKTTPRESRPVTCIGRRTAILRSVRCFARWVLGCIVRRLLGRHAWVRNGARDGLALEKTFHCIEHFAGRPCRVNRSSEFAAVPHAVREPACELLHFAYGVRLIRRLNFFVVARQ